MLYTFQYRTEQEKQSILKQNANKSLIEEKNLIEGNFLVFSDTKPIEIQVGQLQQDNLVLMDALAMTFEEVMMLRAEIGGTI